MFRRIVFVLTPLAAFLSASLHAQELPSAEALAQVQEGETARLDLDSIRKFGDVQGRFDVTVAWADSTRPAPEGYGARKVRYVANCEDGTMMLAAVGLFDRNGQLAKTLIVPPRAVDPVKPPKGTEQAKWIQRVCMF